MKVPLDGDYAAASPRLEESAALWRPLGDNPKLAYALIFLSIATMGRGEVERARGLAEESVALFREGDDAFGLAASLSALGVVFRARGTTGRHAPRWRRAPRSRGRPETTGSSPCR